MFNKNKRTTLFTKQKRYKHSTLVNRDINKRTTLLTIQKRYKHSTLVNRDINKRTKLFTNIKDIRIVN
jgi:hypothetical protein